MRFFYVAFITLGWISQTFAEEPGFAWQETEGYRAPNAQTYFPEDANAGKELDRLFQNRTQISLSDEELLEVVRNGLRNTTRHRTLILRWIGNKYIWGKSPQHPLAIEIMYHAADFSGPNADPLRTRHYAVYFGLSVVEKKTPAILRTLTNLCMKVDDPNDLSRVAWGARSQQKELLVYLKPFLNSEDEKIRQKAITVEKIFKGELKAFAWAAEQAKIRAKEKYGDKLPELKKNLEQGTSKKREETLRIIMQNRITLIMDDSFIDSLAQCASDNDPSVRNTATILIGNRWVWSAQKQNKKAITVMLKQSKDEHRKVRYNAVYYGLSTVREKNEEVVQRLIDLALVDREPNLFHRITWGLSRDRIAAAKILNQYIEKGESLQAKQAEEVYEKITGKKYSKN